MTSQVTAGVGETYSSASAPAAWCAARNLTMIAARLGGPNRQQSPDPLNNPSVMPKAVRHSISSAREAVAFGKPGLLGCSTSTRTSC